LELETLCLVSLAFVKIKYIKFKNNSKTKKSQIWYNFEDLTVATIDSFQGKEKDIINISCVLTKDIVLLDNDNRFNETSKAWFNSWFGGKFHDSK